MRWIEFTSPFAYLFKLPSISHWINVATIDGCTPCNCFYKDGMAALAACGIEPGEDTVSWILTVCFLVLYRLMAYAMLLVQAKRKGKKRRHRKTVVAPLP